MSWDMEKKLKQPLHIHTDRVMKDKIRRPSEAEFRDEIKEEMKILLRVPRGEECSFVVETNGEPKFKIDLAGQGRDIYPTRAVGNAQHSMVVNLVPGGSCSHLNFARNISYSFNMYFQFHFQAEEACEFEGFGEVVTDDPSSGGCVFPLEVVRGEQDQSGDNSSGVQEVPKCAMFLYLLSILWALLL
ncbi:hypothetical protein BUALT_Bualt08G0006000 [Buddleja alternifolia]|uniref:X8 domain-containing protein n=1 Tax=Buddleja alternifolia TaxID=168488 RepID=A0AAV6X3Z6_9LAMI|nr:hypothetical protein BUALT_Bualt08G0006000 [Buddleja alternifolia]